MLNVKDVFSNIQYKPSILLWWLAQVNRDKKYRSDTLDSFIPSNRSSSKEKTTPFNKLKCLHVGKKSVSRFWPNLISKYEQAIKV